MPEIIAIKESLPVKGKTGFYYCNRRPEVFKKKRRPFNCFLLNPTVTLKKIYEIREWCDVNMPEKYYYYNYKFYIYEDSDATFFAMAWA